ncbi:Alpha/Beta hydrolase protein [Mycena olivaceomarginata]|nr:Alpha/Beta hydrolase protein [Mycena olivaceomarginata]
MFVAAGVVLCVRAQSPIIFGGDFRFRAPQLPTNDTGLQDATVQPNQCFQASINGVTRTAWHRRTRWKRAQLSVYYPSDTAGTPVEDLPVLVWIHGGGYVAGRASLYDGEDVINQSNRGIVVVIIQYRLGIFVKKNGALNAGLLDQDFALRWVNKHIAKFGGDPARVTIWGESAGAGSVLQHVVANNGKTQPQLFRGAITSSTFLPLAVRVQRPHPRAATSAIDAFSCLQTVNATALETANTQITISGFYGTYLFVPVVDGSFITQRPTASLLQGAVNGEMLLSVTNTFEGTSFANKVGSLYAGLGTQLFQESAIIGESTLICPTYYLLRAFHGRAFKAEFAIPPGLHSYDVPYYFPSIVTPLFKNTSFINAFAQSFMSFGISLNPNVKIDPTTITPPWQKWEGRHMEMLFNSTAAGLPLVEPMETSDALLERCQCVSSIHPCVVTRF